jgi:uncharacterized protein YfdQ (DUF2303 family)
MTDRTETDALLDELRSVSRLKTLDDSGIYYDMVTGEVVDIRAKLADALSLEHPNRKTGTYTVRDIDAFVEYVQKHGLDETELWGYRDGSTVKAVIDAHAADRAGWEQHVATLHLEADPDWRAFIERDGQMMQQARFAEFIEDHLHVFAKPRAADMLELAQTFQATTKVDFQSSSRLKSGETQLVYNEAVSAGAGKKGSLAIPDEFTVGLSVYRGTEPYAVNARFRYRIEGQTLQLGYRLVRPDKVLDDAFDQVTSRVSTALTKPVWRN